MGLFERALAGRNAHPAAMVASGAALARLLTFVPIPLFGEVAVSLAGFPPLLVGLALGPLAGASTALLTFAGAGPAAIALSVARPAAVAWATRKRVPALVAMLAFWCLAEGPLLLLQGGLEARGALAAAAALVAGLLDVSLSELALGNGGVRGLIRPVGPYARRRPLRALLVSAFVVFAALPPVLIAGFQGRAYAEGRNAEVRQEIQRTARVIASRLEDRLDRHRLALEVAAPEIAESLDSPSALRARLARVRAAYPEYLSLLVADRAGVIVAADVGSSLAPLSSLGSAVVVADRDYFRMPMATGGTFVSDAFRGRGFGRDVVVAVSVPLVGEGVEPSGVVEGSLDLRRFSELAGGGSAEDRTLVVDRALRVVASAPRPWPGSAGGPALELGDDLAPSRLGEALRSEDEPAASLARLEPLCLEPCVAGRSRISGVGWQVAVARPVAGFRAEIESYLLRTLVWVLLPIALAIAAASRVAWQVTVPLAGLARAQAQLASRREVPAVPEPSRSGPAEIARLVDGFREVSATLAESYAALGRTAAERERLNVELQRLLGELERKVEERTAELAAAKALAERHGLAKGRFLAHMSHEIRTPLNAVIGFSELLLGSGLGPAQRERALALRSSADALLAIVNGILDLSKIEAGHLELDESPIAVRDLLDDTLAQFAQRAHEKAIELVGDVAPTVPVRTELDGARLRQVLINLIGNAVRFTERGAVVVEVEALDRALRWHVRDTGVGIPQALQERLFAPYEQLSSESHQRAGGTGLGLAITKSLVEAMGGTISCSSRPGQGSVFTFTVATRALSAPPSPPDLAGRRAVVGASQPALVAMLRKRLEECGVEVESLVERAPGAGGLAFPRADLALIDPEIPGALDAVLEARRSWPALAVVLLMPLGQPLPEPAERLGAARLSRPIRQRQLAELLDRSFDPAGRGEPLAVVLAGSALARKGLEGRLRRAGFAVVATGEVAEARHAVARLDPVAILVDMDLGPAAIVSLGGELRAAAGAKPARVVWLSTEEAPPPEGFDERLPRPPRLEALIALRARVGGGVAGRGGTHDV